jgi:ABC-2 type transport system ATP-binding protein
MSDNVLETHGLTRYYGRRCALRELTLSVPRGCVFAFLGRNGSGKTTTIRLLLGLLAPTRGSSRVLGCDSRILTPEVRGRIGYMSESHSLYGWMRVAEAGRFQAGFYPRWNQKIFQAVVDYFRLDARGKARDLSRGERAGLSLALTLAGEPELLILDDPALGLDPVARRALVESMIYFTRGQDRTIFFSSHLLSDVERVADYIAVLDRGVLKARCTLDTFRERVRRVVVRYRGTPPAVSAVPGLLYSTHEPGLLTLTIANYDPRTQQALASAGATQVEDAPISLEDAFIGYLGERGERSFFLSPMGVES